MHSCEKRRSVTISIPLSSISIQMRFAFPARLTALSSHFPDYSRFGGDIVARPLDDITDVFDVCVVCRLSEDNETVLDLFDAIVDCARNTDISD